MGGIVVILPLFLLYLLISELFETVIAMASPLGNLILDRDYQPEHPFLLAAAILAAAAFVLGLAIRSGPGNKVMEFADNRILGAFPPYRAFKHLTNSLLGSRELSRFKPAFYHSTEGCREYVFIIEEVGDGSCCALFPLSPTPMVGQVRIIPTDKVELIDAGMLEVFDVLSFCGIGSGKFVK